MFPLKGLQVLLRGSLNKFPDFFVSELLLIVHPWNSSPLRSNLLRLQCTCCTVPTTSERLHGSSFMWAYQLLYFGLRPGKKCHSKVMHRKEVTHSNGSYERKSCGRKLAEEMGRGKKKFPWYSHRLMHRKRVTCELHGSYFRWMTINHAISKIE